MQGAKGAGKRTKTEARPLDRRPSPPTHARTGISPPSRDKAPESDDYDEQRRGDDIPRAHVLREKLGKGDLFRRSLQVVGLPSPPSTFGVILVVCAPTVFVGHLIASRIAYGLLPPPNVIYTYTEELQSGNSELQSLPKLPKLPKLLVLEFP